MADDGVQQLVLRTVEQLQEVVHSLSQNVTEIDIRLENVASTVAQNGQVLYQGKNGKEGITTRLTIIEGDIARINRTLSAMRSERARSGREMIKANTGQTGDRELSKVEALAKIEGIKGKWRVIGAIGVIIFTSWMPALASIFMKSCEH